MTLALGNCALCLRLDGKAEQTARSTMSVSQPNSPLAYKSTTQNKLLVPPVCQLTINKEGPKPDEDKMALQDLQKSLHVRHLVVIGRECRCHKNNFLCQSLAKTLCTSRGKSLTLMRAILVCRPSYILVCMARPLSNRCSTMAAASFFT